MHASSQLKENKFTHEPFSNSTAIYLQASNLNNSYRVSTTIQCQRKRQDRQILSPRVDHVCQHHRFCGV